MTDISTIGLKEIHTVTLTLLIRFLLRERDSSAGKHGVDVSTWNGKSYM